MSSDATRDRQFFRFFFYWNVLGVFSVIGAGFAQPKFNIVVVVLAVFFFAGMIICASLAGDDNNHRRKN